MSLRSREIGLACAALSLASCGGTSTDAATDAVTVVPASTSAVVPSLTPTPTPAATKDFDLAYYLKANPDVAAAYGQNAKQHYDQYGRWEGRLPYEGAIPWHADASTLPADYASAPACALEALPAWAPAKAKQIRIRFKLTRFGDGTPCERSYSIYGGGINSSGADIQEANFPIFNISGQDGMMIVGEALSLPSQGSQGELIIKVPEWAQASGEKGWFNFWLRSAEYNPVARAGIRVYLGGDRPAGTQYNADALVLPAPTAYPIDLGNATYNTDFLSDLAAGGWRFSAGVQLNGMIGVFTTPEWKTASGKATDNYPIQNVGGERVRALVMRDHRTDPAGGKYLFSTPMISRVLGDGIYGYRKADIDLPKPLLGTDAGFWGIKPDGGWPPEFDTQEGFAGNPGRLAQTIHMPLNGAPTIGFTPLVDVYGRHEWLEEFGRQTYRLWIDRKLVVERPNYLAGIPFETTFSIEGPGGAGGTPDMSQPYDGMTILLHRLSWWQR